MGVVIGALGVRVRFRVSRVRVRDDCCLLYTSDAADE